MTVECGSNRTQSRKQNRNNVLGSYRFGYSRVSQSRLFLCIGLLSNSTIRLLFQRFLGFERISSNQIVVHSIATLQ
jgi:hypothetical protein